jgi:hypothetical protein
MTIDHWLIIAVIISTLIQPVIGAVATFRISQPKPSPEQNQPKNRIQRIGGCFIRLFTSPWYVPPFLILVNTFNLLTEFHSHTPITRGTVLQIAFAAGGILYGAVLFLLYAGWQQISRQWEINRIHAATIKEILSLIGRLVDSTSKTDVSILDLIKGICTDLTDSLNATTKSLKSDQQIQARKSKQEIEDRLPAALKDLFED